MIESFGRGLDKFWGQPWEADGLGEKKKEEEGGSRPSGAAVGLVWCRRPGVSVFQSLMCCTKGEQPLLHLAVFPEEAVLHFVVPPRLSGNSVPRGGQEVFLRRELMLCGG